ncbi:MAG: glycosyltransferase, partial [Suilimivivens sp.]
LSEPDEHELQGGRIRNFLTRFRKLRRIWKEEKPDAIVSFIGKNNIMAILTSLGMGIPVAVSVRGEPGEEYYNGLLRFLARNLFYLADGVILQTKLCMEFFPKGVRKKAIILKNPVNPVFFREPYRGEREKTIVAVGRVDENKNHEMLIRAFAGIADEFPEYRLIIYGDGDKRSDLLKLTKELKLEDRISLPGNIDNVADAIYKTRVFVLSSNTEGMPNTLIEAMILGLAVVSTDCPCGGPAELIVHGVNGLLSPVKDVNAMKENLQYILNDLHRADEMAHEASKTSDIYDVNKVYLEWENYLKYLTCGK